MICLPNFLEVIIIAYPPPAPGPAQPDFARGRSSLFGSHVCLLPVCFYERAVEYRTPCVLFNKDLVRGRLSTGRDGSLKKKEQTKDERVVNVIQDIMFHI